MIDIRSQTDTIKRVKELLANLRYLQSVQKGSQIAISSIEFVTPLSIIPVAAIINEKELKHDYHGVIESYLKVIRFPEGISELESISSQKSYIPIIHFHVGNLNKQKMSEQLSALHSKFLDLIKMKIIADERFIELVTNNTFGFLLGEMMDNIEEHSNCRNIYLLAQYWPIINSCELCLLDDGDGLFGSLKNAGRDVKDSQDALRKILETGLSAKTEYGEKERGTGIKNIRSVITNKEINGELFIMSGNSAFFHSAKSGEIFINFKDYFWRGTIVMMKLNKPINTFNLYDYVK